MIEPDLLLMYNEALMARQRAYAPYSAFSVGAAIEAGNGSIYSGCNVENGSFGLSICAERVAMARAIADGQRSFSRVVVVASPIASPCGACRQFLSEFLDDQTPIHAFEAGNRDVTKSWTMRDLLPDRFRFGTSD
jgi:cytidine deaminase